MVISDKHRFVFVNLPQTASTAIARELVASYGAREFCFKHAIWRTDYLRAANEDQKKYRVISGIRDPMDIAVSLYFKVRSDHENRYSETERHIIQHGRLRKHISKWRNDRYYRRIVTQGRSFTEWFLSTYRIVPYASWSILDHHRFDHLIRFEDLQAEFAAALRKLGIEPVRPLPLGNKTAMKEKRYMDYFDTPRAIRRAKYIFGPYCAEWGYTFPKEWDHHPVPRIAFVVYRLLNVFRRFYWIHLR